MLVLYYFERVGGIEPPSSDWKSDIIATIRYPPALKLRRASPLDFNRYNQFSKCLFLNQSCRGAETRTRTTWSQTKRATITQRPACAKASAGKPAWPYYRYIPFLLTYKSYPQKLL